MADDFFILIFSWLILTFIWYVIPIALLEAFLLIFYGIASRFQIFTEFFKSLKSKKWKILLSLLPILLFLLWHFKIIEISEEGNALIYGFAWLLSLSMSSILLPLMETLDLFVECDVASFLCFPTPKNETGYFLEAIACSFTVYLILSIFTRLVTLKKSKIKSKTSIIDDWFGGYILIILLVSFFAFNHFAKNISMNWVFIISIGLIAPLLLIRSLKNQEVIVWKEMILKRKTNTLSYWVAIGVFTLFAIFFIFVIYSELGQIIK